MKSFRVFSGNILKLPDGYKGNNIKSRYNYMDGNTAFYFFRADFWEVLHIVGIQMRAEIPGFVKNPRKIEK